MVGFSRGWLASALCLVCFCVGAPASARSKKGLRQYIVQRGESCWSIALKLYGDGRKYKIIHKYNKLGPLPHILKPGQIIYLPGTARKADAQIEWLKRQVQARPPRSVDWREARQQMNLWRLYKVKTGNRSAAGIRFEDRSYMKVRERALLVIYGSSAQQIRARRFVKRTILVEKGVVRGGLSSLRKKNKKDSITIKTPSSEVKLESELAQIEVDTAKTSIVSVYDGQAKVKAKGKQVKVPKRYGTYVKKGKKPAKPIPLPDAPAWEDPIPERVVFLPRKSGEATFWWKPVKRAQRYRFEISRKKNFRQVMLDRTYPPKKRKRLPGEALIQAVVGKGVLGFSYKNLKLGTYYARVAAIDKFRLEGFPSRVLRIRVLPMKASKDLRPRVGGIYEVAGLLKISPPADSGVVAEVSVNGAGFEAFSSPLRMLKTGLYKIRFRAKGAQRPSSKIDVSILPVKAKITAPKVAMKVGGKAADLALSLSAKFLPFARGPKSSLSGASQAKRSERGVALPGLKLMAYPGGELPLKPLHSGVFKSQIPAPTAFNGPTITLVASWVGGELGRTTLSVEAPPAPRIQPKPAIVRPLPPPRPPEVFEWQTFSVAMEHANAGPMMPTRAARPVSSLQLNTFFQRHSPNQTDDLFLRMSFLGQIALLKQRLGFTAELPWLQTNLTNEVRNQNKLGDLRLGARYVAWKNEHWLVTPSLRLSLPTGGRPRPSFPASDGTLTPLGGTVFEPGVILAWHPASWLTLQSNLMFLLDTNFNDSVGLFGMVSLGAEARWWRLSFGLEGNVLFGAQRVGGTGDFAAFEAQGIGVSGALRLYFDRVRIGLVGGVMIDPNSADSVSGSIGLNLALGFRGP